MEGNILILKNEQGQILKEQKYKSRTRDKKGRYKTFRNQIALIIKITKLLDECVFQNSLI